MLLLQLSASTTQSAQAQPDRRHTETETDTAGLGRSNLQIVWLLCLGGNARAVSHFSRFAFNAERRESETDRQDARIRC